MKMVTAWWQSPIGLIRISGSAAGISAIAFARRGPSNAGQKPEELIPAVQQLEEYFRGERRAFTLRLAPAGTDFQKKVWSELGNIPFGATATYGGIAAVLRNPGAARAVGRANHLNPISIVIPCHRVIGAGSELRGYGGGLWRKRWLLEHERSSEPARIAAVEPGPPRKKKPRRCAR